MRSGTERTRRPRLAYFVLALGSAVACPASGRSSPEAPLAHPNVLLITLDTTRADHLGCYGYARPTSPNIDRLAGGSVVYTRAIATSSWTLPSHASLFTGKFPTSHGAVQDPEGPLRLTQAIPGPESWGRYRVHGLPPEQITLADLLVSAGYTTGAVVAGPWLKRVFGLAKGFQYYDDAEISGVSGRLAEQVTDAALRFVAKRKEGPFFLFLNYYDPHYPYSPPAEYAQMFLEDLARERVGGDPNARTRTLYDAEIRYMDHHLGRLFDELHRRDLYDESLVIVTSDHGDLLGEHGQMGHGFHLFQGEIRIPLIVKHPRDEFVPERRAETVQLIDVLPLILERLAIPPPSGIQGGAPPDVGHPILAEVYPRSDSDRFVGSWRALIDGDLKFLWNSRGEHRLFDLKNDPGETANLVVSQPDRAAVMESILARYLESLPPPAARGPEGAIDAETREALRRLGYFE
jgi:arylsulfatase A-like enzyme